LRAVTASCFTGRLPEAARNAAEWVATWRRPQPGCFGPYRLDADGARLWRGAIPLQPRPFAVLSYLATRPGAIVSRDSSARCGGTHVTKAVLKVVRAIREALDDADAPRYIETVGHEATDSSAPAPPPASARRRRAFHRGPRRASRLHAALRRR
jgi:hypothetical protein